MNIIEAENIIKTYQMGNVNVPVLNGISLTVKKGEMIAITGPSGSGKSTLMHILGLLDVPDSGSFRLQGQLVSGLDPDRLAGLRSEKVGFIFQQFHLLSRTSALENVGLPYIYSGHEYSEKHAAELLDLVGLGNRLDHKPNELSGGQQQRVAIARAMINSPEIIFADEPTGNLDTKSQFEIMQILRKLNSLGITIIIVTHEAEIAKVCDRIIQIRDGSIQSDRKNKPLHKEGQKMHERMKTSPKPGAANTLDNYFIQDQKSGKRNIANLVFEYARQAIKTLMANKIRTALSMLGILIGVAALISVLALGEGARKSIERQLSSMGSNLLNLRPGRFHSGAVSLGAGEVTRFTLEDKKAIEEIPAVKRTSAIVHGRVQAVYKNNNWSTNVTGSNAQYSQIHNAVPESGRFFTGKENLRRARVAVIGQTVQRELFGNIDPVGEIIRLNKIEFQVIGILPAKGANAFRDQDDIILIPVLTFMKRLDRRDYLDHIEIEVATARDMPGVENRLKQLIVGRHRLAPSQVDSFQIRNMADIQEAVSSTNKTMSLLLVSIAAVSLLVGGIGIMNIMLVSVKERTREIGLRKAIGARSQDIQVQFLIESLLIGLIGGTLGLALGYTITVVMSRLSGWTTEITLNAVLLSILFSSLTGTIFGLWPARQAAALNPITALRYE